MREVKRGEITDEVLVRKLTAMIAQSDEDELLYIAEKLLGCEMYAVGTNAYSWKATEDYCGGLDDNTTTKGGEVK